MALFFMDDSIFGFQLKVNVGNKKGEYKKQYSLVEKQQANNKRGRESKHLPHPTTDLGFLKQLRKVSLHHTHQLPLPTQFTPIKLHFPFSLTFFTRPPLLQLELLGPACLFGSPSSRSIFIFLRLSKVVFFLISITPTFSLTFSKKGEK